jgi:hypothetical protein
MIWCIPSEGISQHRLAIRTEFKTMHVKGDSVVIKLKRYLGNLNTLEVHDTLNEQPACRLDEIKPDHQRWYDSLGAAKADRSYDNCSWCLGGSTR